MYLIEGLKWNCGLYSPVITLMSTSNMAMLRFKFVFGFKFFNPDQFVISCYKSKRVIVGCLRSYYGNSNKNVTKE